MTDSNHDMMEALKKIEKERMANPSVGLLFQNGHFTIPQFPHPVPYGIYPEFEKLLDELAEFRVEKWIANHYKEKKENKRQLKSLQN